MLQVSGISCSIGHQNSLTRVKNDTDATQIWVKCVASVFCYEIFCGYLQHFGRSGSLMAEVTSETRCNLKM